MIMQSKNIVDVLQGINRPKKNKKPKQNTGENSGKMLIRFSYSEKHPRTCYAIKLAANQKKTTSDSSLVHQK